jgi:hypothetical protein
VELPIVDERNNIAKGDRGTNCVRAHTSGDEGLTGMVTMQIIVTLALLIDQTLNHSKEDKGL